MSDWKNVQYKDGKFHTGTGGGGGSSTFAGLDDVSFNNIQNGQVPKYNSTTQKWENANESGGGGTVTDVQVDGVSVVNQQGVAEIEMPTPPTIPVEDVEVNGASVVNAQNVAEITSYKEVTLAEYQALPSSKLSDNVLYCIKDTGGADSFPPLIYSDEEREVGVWRDGKPLYQKNFHFSTPQQLPKYGTPGFKVGTVSNIETIVDFSGISTNYNEQRLTTSFSIWLENANDIYLSLQTGHANPAIYLNDLTLQYTKTTDTAGSGTWTTQGVYAHHYSTEEKVIGTWIDGKPVYEKTIHIDSISSTSFTVNHGISNLKEIVSLDGSIRGTMSNAYYYEPLNDHAGMNSGDSTRVADINQTIISVQVGSGRASTATDANITLRYTKTTD